MLLSRLRNPKPISASRISKLIIPTRRFCHSSSTSEQQLRAVEEEGKNKNKSDTPTGFSDGMGIKTELAGSWRQAIFAKMKGLLGVERRNAKVNSTTLENSTCHISQQEVDNDLRESRCQSSKTENSNHSNLEEKISAASRFYLTGKQSSLDLKGLNASSVIARCGDKDHFEPNAAEEQPSGAAACGEKNYFEQNAEEEQPSRAENLLCFERKLAKASIASSDSAIDSVKPMKTANHMISTHSTQPSDAAFEIGELPTSATSAGKMKGLQDLFTERNDEQSQKMGFSKSDALSPDIKIVPALGKAKGNGIKNLIDSIKKLPLSKGPSIITSKDVGLFDMSYSLSNGGSTESIQNPSADEQPIKQKYYVTDRNEKSYGAEAVEKSLHSTTDMIFTGMSRQDNLLIRFLDKNMNEDSFFSKLDDCELVAIFPLFKGSRFKDICLQFKTKEGLQKAMRKMTWVFASDAFVDQTFFEGPCNKISVPSAIDDPDIPDELLKNPTRTVKIKELTPDVTLRQLKEALTSCTSSITSLFLGTSSSVAFAEFKTEDAKEKTIEKYAISVAGKQLPVFRIDAPLTTVVRITNFNQNSIGNLVSTCRIHGEVKKVQQKSSYAVDVRFKLSEWPKMLNIVNSLNGLVVDGKQWVAVPSPFIPPEVLHVLWGHPEGRKHVKTVLYRLLQNLEGSDAAELADAVARVYGDRC